MRELGRREGGREGREGGREEGVRERKRERKLCYFSVSNRRILSRCTKTFVL